MEVNRIQTTSVSERREPQRYGRVLVLRILFYYVFKGGMIVNSYGFISFKGTPKELRAYLKGLLDGMNRIA